MSTDGREFVGFSAELWTQVDGTVESVFARLAACRRALPVGEQLGAKSVLVRPMTRTPKPAAKTFASLAAEPKALIPLRIWTLLDVDVQDTDDVTVVLDTVTDATNRLAKAEDASLLLGAASQPLLAQLGAAFDGDLPLLGLTTSNQPKEKPAQDQGKGVPAPARKPAQDLIIDALSALEAKGVVGKFAAIVSPRFMGNARTPGVPGGADSVPHILDLLHADSGDGFVSSSILPAGSIAGVVLRTQTKAFELIVTAKPRVVFAGRQDSTTSLRVEESFVLATYDPDAAALIIEAAN